MCVRARAELYAGLSWLGLVMTPAQIYELVRAIDSDGDGLISFADFKVSAMCKTLRLSRETLPNPLNHPMADSCYI